MPFINTRTGELNKTLWDVRLAYPQVSFPAHVDQHEEFLFYEEVNPPLYDEITHDLVEATPVGGKQQWMLVEVSPEEAEARRRARIPSVVSIRQARLALYEAGLLDDIEQLVQSLGATAAIEWEYAQFVERNHPLVGALGLSEVELDELFLSASQK